MEDFMNVSQTAVTNMVNLAFFMVNFAQKILEHFRRNSVDDFSILDLKAFYRGSRYLDELIKLLRSKTRTNFDFSDSESSGKHWGNPSYFSS
jgi:putative transposase